MEDHTVTLNGVDLHRTIGDGPVLFLVPPGWGVASVYLQRAFSPLAKHLRLVFIDTRGSGFSGRPADAMQMGSVNMADDLEALRVHLGLPEISILGHSNSGAISLAYAQRYPERVNKLVLIDSQVLGLSAAADTQRILQERSTDPRFKEATRVVSTFFTGQMNPAASDESLEAFIAQVLPSTFTVRRRRCLWPGSSCPALSLPMLSPLNLRRTRLFQLIRPNPKRNKGEGTHHGRLT